MKTNSQSKIGIISAVLFLIIHFTNDYMEFKDRECLVLEKVQNEHRSYLILKYKETMFDLTVGPATFYQATTNNIIHFNLRQFDIKQTERDNTIYFFGYIITGIAAFLLLASWALTETSLHIPEQTH